MDLNYPPHLTRAVQHKTEGFQLEGLLRGQGNPNACLMLIGEAPGRTEIESHVPFSGKAGEQLTTALHQIGLGREDIYITSAVRSRPYAIRKNKRNSTITFPNRTPLKKEIHAHAPLLDWEIEQIQPAIIATLGNTALHRLMGTSLQISKHHGRARDHEILRFNPKTKAYEWSEQRYSIIPLYHPAAIFYNKQLADVILKDWRTVQATYKNLCL